MRQNTTLLSLTPSPSPPGEKKESRLQIRSLAAQTCQLAPGQGTDCPSLGQAACLSSSFCQLHRCFHRRTFCTITEPCDKVQTSARHWRVPGHWMRGKDVLLKGVFSVSRFIHVLVVCSPVSGEAFSAALTEGVILSHLSRVLGPGSHWALQACG